MNQQNYRIQPYLDKIAKLAPTIRENADRAEQQRQLPKEVADAFHEAGLYRILLPKSMGGGELTIPEAFQVCEEVARIDGSAGWNLLICSGGPIFGHMVSRAAFEKVFSDPRGVSAGSLNPMETRVTKVEGGWRFGGRATYVSGSAQATYITVAGVVLSEGAPQFTNGMPVVRGGMLPIEKVTVLDTWSTAGMRGTGSNDCVYEDVFVPEEFTFDWFNARSPWQRGGFANIPLALQAAGLAAAALGIARHALDALNEIAQAKVPTATRALLKERPVAQTEFARAEGILRAARAYFYQAHEEAWRKGEAGEPFTRNDHADARLAVVTAVKLALQATDIVVDLAGMNATRTTSPVERCWRDVHTAAQHVLLSTSRFEVIGRILFGLDPGSPVI
ncbi:MAG: acyl-CoA dehydrogenase family protein [Candidatus Binataceae bacterium]